MKQRKCYECQVWNGHASYCLSRGYAAVGPHPDAPKAPIPREGLGSRFVVQCPCGIARLDCEYHRPEANADNGPATERYEVFDALPRFMQESVEQATSSLQAAGLLNARLEEVFGVRREQAVAPRIVIYDIASLSVCFGCVFLSPGGVESIEVKGKVSL